MNPNQLDDSGIPNNDTQFNKFHDALTKLQDGSGPSNDEKEEVEQPVRAENEQTDEDASNDDENDVSENSNDDESPSEEEDERTYLEDGDDVYTKIKIGDEEHEVPIKDLKRLYGQEKSLTQKSQEVADKRKSFEEQELRVLTAQKALLDEARKDFEPYSKIDWIAASRRQDITQEEFSAMRQVAQEKLNRLRFLEQGHNQIVQQHQERVTKEMTERAQTAITDLRNEKSVNYIPDFDNSKLAEIQNYAVNAGVPRNIVDGIIDAPVIKLLHDAYQHSLGKAAIAQSKKVNNTPKKIVKGAVTSTGKPKQNTKFDKAKAEYSSKGRHANDAGAALFEAFLNQ